MKTNTFHIFTFQTKSFSSSEEGEVEECHSDHFVLDDGKRRARHEDPFWKSSTIFSSESEVYYEPNQYPSSRNESE